MTTAGTSQDALLPPDEREELARRLDQAVQNFVDSPRQAVAMADRAFEEAATGLTQALAEHRRALRAAWQPDGDAAAAPETEELRLLLNRYRDTTERLLRA